MKKFFLLLVAVLICWQSSGDEYKEYYDKKNGYKGEAICLYMGLKGDMYKDDIYSLRDKFIHFHINNGLVEGINEVKKLTKEEIFLIWSALEEYNYAENEVYVLNIKKEKYPGYQWVYYIWVQITDNGNSFIWTGANVCAKSKS